MIVRTEFSFRQVFGPIQEVVARLPSYGGIIADDGCWGHVPFAKACKAAGKRAVLGRRFPLGERWVVVIPRSPAGLRDLYGTPDGPLDLARAVDLDWYLAFPGLPDPRLGPRALPSYVPGVVKAPAQAPEVLGRTLEAPETGLDRPSPGPGLPYRGPGTGGAYPGARGYAIAFSDNLYPSPGDREPWELMLGRLANGRPGSLHILTPDELLGEGAEQYMIDRLRDVIQECDTPLPVASNIKYPVADAQRELAAMANAELKRRGLNKTPYKERLKHELSIIAEKQFADYFLVISDMLRYAKQHMLVGPARGSSCGSLACWLVRITEVDPIRHGLIFERFIDINRADLPDIDIDFPDDKRHMVIEYLASKYGQQSVAQLGTIMRYKPKSALTDVAKNGQVPLWELDKLKDVMIERSSGDMRYRNQLSDSFEQLDVGKDLLEKYPVLALAGRLEDHARSAGTHAAGIIVCNEAVTHFCAVVEGGAQIDKKMAEALNMLKIDALGLRTLSVIEECCALVGRDPLSMYDLPLNDTAVFDLLNAHKFGCVFQFEGLALQTVAKQVKINCFQDIAAITALARPGPLSGGETVRWIEGKNTGQVNPLHPALEPYTREEFGCIVYQEQVMRVCRELGNFSWADTAEIRRLMSKTLGNEAFAKFGVQFKAGAIANGVSEADAAKIWKAIDQMGSWAFNKSHAVAYGIVSYWCAWLKAKYPIEYAVANLRHSRDDDSVFRTLREIMRDGGVEFISVDKHRSTDRWEYADGALLGPLTGLPGCGAKTAREIIVRREGGIEYGPKHLKILEGVSKFADYAPTRKLWGHLYDNPTAYFKTVNEVTEINVINDTPQGGQYCIIGKLIKKNLRDKNDEKWLAKRNGKRVPENMKDYLLFNLEDDTGQIMCCISTDKYQQLGKRIVEQAALGAWFAVTGKVPEEFKLLMVDKVKWL